MAELKTQENDGSVSEFLEKVEDDVKRADCKVLMTMMRRVTKQKPKMWGTAIVGFGRYHYKYSSGHEGDWMVTGFSPRKQAITIHIMNGFNRYEDLLARLGKHKTAKSCLYIKRLAEVDLVVLEELVGASVAYMREHYACK
jgi:hypothetical protein